VDVTHDIADGNDVRCVATGLKDHGRPCAILLLLRLRLRGRHTLFFRRARIVIDLQCFILNLQALFQIDGFHAT